MPTPLDLTRLENGDPAFLYDDLVRWWLENKDASPADFLQAMTTALGADMAGRYTPAALTGFITRTWRMRPEGADDAG